MQSIIELSKHEDILDVIKGIHYAVVIGVTRITLLAIIAPLNKMLCCAKSRLQCFRSISVVWGKLLGTFISYIFVLDSNLIILDFHWSTSNWKAKICVVSLHNDVRFKGRKFVGKITHGYQQIWRRSLKVQHKMVLTKSFLGKEIKGGVELEVLGESWTWAEDDLAAKRLDWKLK